MTVICKKRCLFTHKKLLQTFYAGKKPNLNSLFELKYVEQCLNLNRLASSLPLFFFLYRPSYNSGFFCCCLKKNNIEKM